MILSQEERGALVAKDENIKSCVRRYAEAKDFINNKEVRYCLWLKGASPAVYRKNAGIMRRLETVQEMRPAGSAALTCALAEKPHLFFSTPQTDSNYLCIPEVWIVKTGDSSSISYQQHPSRATGGTAAGTERRMRHEKRFDRRQTISLNRRQRGAGRAAAHPGSS